jgi:hypothetical protein
MNGCCSTGKDASCSRPETNAGSCPACKQNGRLVATLTVKNLVCDHTRVAANGPYYFCRTPGCSVVYFSDEATFQKSDIKVRVGIKEQEDPIPLCYCFDYTRANIRRDLTLRGHTDIPDLVKAEVQRGFCACDVKNPSGACCLGEITRAVMEINNNG